VLIAASACRADPPDGYPFKSFDLGLQEAHDNGRPLFVYFGRHGCSWCDMTNRRAFVDPEAHRLYTRNFNLVYVDTEGGRRLTLPAGERITEAEFSRRARVRATPMFAFMEPNGRALGSTYGVKTAKDLLDMGRFISEKHYVSQSLGQFLATR
jgi:thioredoxin-related protein